MVSWDFWLLCLKLCSSSSKIRYFCRKVVKIGEIWRFSKNKSIISELILSDNAIADKVEQKSVFWNRPSCEINLRLLYLKLKFDRHTPLEHLVSHKILLSSLKQAGNFVSDYERELFRSKRFQIYLNDFVTIKTISNRIKQFQAD